MVTPQRIVSLVPSITESLFELGLGEKVAGRTEYCVQPAEKVEAIPIVGGTKNIDRKRLLQLKPDLIIANQEENTKDDIEFLQSEGLEVWLQFPKTMRQSLDDLWAMIQRLDVPLQGPRIVTLEKTYEWTWAASRGVPVLPRVFCPIWREPATGQPQWWMTINDETYVHDVLNVCGGGNVFAERDRRYPLAADLDATQEAQPEPTRDTRYPRVTLPEILETQPEAILLPSEPFAFAQEEMDFWMQFTDLPAVQNQRVHLVDGTWLTWHGVHMALTLRELPPLLLKV